MSGDISRSREGSSSDLTQPMLSIITVVFNSDKYIERTLKSIASQTFKNYELVIIDGGSTDKTLEIIARYRDDIQYFISESDNGIYDAMNKGIVASRGVYLLFLNSGDELNNNGVLADVFSKANGEDVLYGETNLVDANHQVMGTRTQMTTRALPNRLTWRSLKKGMVVCHQSYIVKKSIAPQYQLKYKCSADIDWMIQSLKKADKILNVNQVISKYLVGGFSGKNMASCWRERFAVMCEHYGVFSAIFSHVLIIWRAFYFKVGGKMPLLNKAMH